MKYKAKISIEGIHHNAHTTADSQTDAYDKICRVTASRFPGKAFQVLEVNLEVNPDRVGVNVFELLKKILKI